MPLFKRLRSPPRLSSNQRPESISLRPAIGYSVWPQVKAGHSPGCPARGCHFSYNVVCSFVLHPNSSFTPSRQHLLLALINTLRPMRTDLGFRPQQVLDTMSRPRDHGIAPRRKSRSASAVLHRMSSEKAKGKNGPLSNSSFSECASINYCSANRARILMALVRIVQNATHLWLASEGEEPWHQRSKCINSNINNRSDLLRI